MDKELLKELKTFFPRDEIVLEEGGLFPTVYVGDIEIKVYDITKTKIAFAIFVSNTDKVVTRGTRILDKKSFYLLTTIL